MNNVCVCVCVCVCMCKRGEVVLATNRPTAFSAPFPFAKIHHREAGEPRRSRKLMAQCYSNVDTNVCVVCVCVCACVCVCVCVCVC